MRKYIQIISFLLAAVTLSGCENWLDVKPETEVNEDDMFNTEQGFMDALYGIYVNMGKSDLYGGTLQTALDMTAQYYSYYDISECPYGHYQTFEYEHPSCTAISDALWMRIYYCIGLTNNLLKYLDKPEAVQICSNYDYLRGEALALRAYLHFELIRIFAPDVKKNPEYKSIPYRKTFSPDIEPQLKVKEVYQEILADLTEAKQLLSNDVIRTNGPDWLGESEKKEESDDVTDKNEGYYTSDFLKTRKYRMNYYAVKALQARAFLWYGEKENAYAAAMEVIEAKNSDGSKKFDIEAIKTAFPGQDFIIYPEQIFGLYDHQLDDKYSSFFQTGILYKGTSSQEIMKNLYGNTGKDFRELYLWELQRLVDGDRYTIKKYNVTLGVKQIPLIRLSELYFIAIESGSAEQAQKLWDEYRDSRVLDRKDLPTDPKQLQQEILTEFRKEFYAEGQLFYLYKRYNSPREDILFANSRLVVNYILPLPKTELK